MLCGYLPEKDVFKHEYEVYFSNRLLTDGSGGNEDVEKFMISQLRVPFSLMSVGFRCCKL